MIVIVTYGCLRAGSSDMDSIFKLAGCGRRDGGGHRLQERGPG